MLKETQSVLQEGMKNCVYPSQDVHQSQMGDGGTCLTSEGTEEEEERTYAL